MIPCLLARPGGTRKVQQGAKRFITVDGAVRNLAVGWFNGMSLGCWGSAVETLTFHILVIFHFV